MRRTVLAVPFKRASRWGGVYALYLAIVWLFDYVYFPWLTFKFRSRVFVPLYFSVFLVSWAGYYLYEYFREDVFFTEKINGWLERPAAGRIRGKLKGLIARNPRFTFAAISTWWSPLHAYVFFRREETFKFTSFIKALATGSFFCALFWGTVGESFLVSWRLFRIFLHRI